MCDVAVENNGMDILKNCAHFQNTAFCVDAVEGRTWPVRYIMR